MAVEGDTAVVAVGPRLAVIDLADPDAAARVGESPVMSTTLHAVALRGPTALAAATLGGLWVFDVADRRSVGTRAYQATADVIMDLAFLDGSAAHVATVDLSGRLRLLDVSDPDRIVEVGSYQLPAPSGGVAVAGEHVLATYCANGGRSGGLAVLRASPPEAPQLLGQVDVPECAFDVAVQGTHAYVAGGDRVIVFDVSDASRPRAVGEIVADDLPDLFSPPHVAIAAYGDRVYVASGGPMDARIDDVPIQGGMLVVDVTDPASPRVAGSWATGTSVPAGHEMTDPLVDLAPAGDRVIATEDGGHVHVLAVSATGVPRLAARLDLGLRGQDLTASDGVLYQSDGWGVQAMSLDDPISPRPGRYFGDFAGTPGQLDAEGERLLVATYGTFANVLLSLDARSLEPLGTVREIEVHDMALRDGLAYVAGRKATCISDPGTAVLRVLDVSHAGDPRSVGDLDLGSGWGVFSRALRGIALAGDQVVIAGGQAPLVVVDVSDPALPHVTGRLAPDPAGPQSPSDIAVVGRFALLLEGQRLHVVDIGDPTALRLVTTYDLDARMSRIVVDGTVAYIVGTWRMVVLDVTDPTAPRAIGALDAPPAGRFFGIAVWGDHAYVGADAMGVLVIPRARAVADGTPRPDQTRPPTSTPELTATQTAATATSAPDATPWTSTPGPSATTPIPPSPRFTLSLPLVSNGARPDPPTEAPSATARSGSGSGVPVALGGVACA